MARLIVGLIAWFGLGVIIAEIINTTGLFGFRLKVLFVAGPIAILYLISQIALKYFERKAEEYSHAATWHRKIKTYYHLMLCIIGLCFLVSIPFLWWGVIKKLAMAANEGRRFF